MVLNTKLLKNFTKAAAYSTIEVASTFTPHTVDIARSVSTGVNDTRNYIRRNLTRIGTYAGEATDRGTIGSRLRKIRDDAYASLNAGTHSLEDLMDDIGTSLTDFEYDIEESTLNDVGSSNTENANLGAPGGETGDGGAELPFEQAQLRMAATVGKTQIDALRQLNGNVGIHDDETGYDDLYQSDHADAALQDSRKAVRRNQPKLDPDCRVPTGEHHHRS